MKSKKTNGSTDVIEVDAEEMLPEIPLDKVIDKALIKANVTEQVISALKDKYGTLRLKSIDDKESYLEVKEGRKEVRKVGIITEKICKKGREDATAIQRKWLAKEKEILDKIAEVEDPLNAEIKKFEDEVERKEIEEQKKQEQVYINRQATLFKYGAQYNNGSLELRHISYGVELIKQADDEQWNDTILPKYRKVYEEIEVARVEEENNRKAEMELQKKQREELEAQQAEFKKQQEDFAKQQLELQKQKDEVERQHRLEQDRKDAIEKQKRQTIINDRVNQLRGLGMEYNHIYNNHSFEDIVVDVNSIGTDEEWNSLIQKITPDINGRKEVAEKRRIEVQEQQKQAAIKKALADQKLKEDQERQRKEEELAQSSDKVKWNAFIESVKAIEIFDMRSGQYRRKMQVAKELIEKVLAL